MRASWPKLFLGCILLLYLGFTCSFGIFNKDFALTKGAGLDLVVGRKGLSVCIVLLPQSFLGKFILISANLWFGVTIETSCAIVASVGNYFAFNLEVQQIIVIIDLLSYSLERLLVWRSGSDL